MYLEEVHLAEMGMRVGPRLALMDSLHKLKRAVAARNKHVAKVAAVALLQNEGAGSPGHPGAAAGNDSSRPPRPPALDVGASGSMHGMPPPLKVVPPTSPLRLAMYNQQQQSFHNMAHTLQQQQSMWALQQQQRQFQHQQQQKQQQQAQPQLGPGLGSPLHASQLPTSPASTLYSHALSYRGPDGVSEVGSPANAARGQRQPPLVPSNSYSGRLPQAMGSKKVSRHLVKETSVFYLRAQEEKVRVRRAVLLSRALVPVVHMRDSCRVARAGPCFRLTSVPHPRVAYIRMRDGARRVRIVRACCSCARCVRHLPLRAR